MAHKKSINTSEKYTIQRWRLEFVKEHKFSLSLSVIAFGHVKRFDREYHLSQRLLIPRPKGAGH